MAWATHSKPEHSGRGRAIFSWLHAVNGRAPSTAVKVALHLSQQTSRVAYQNSGKLIVAYQSIEAIANAIGLTDRTIQKNVRKLQVLGLLAVGANRGGYGRSNCYTLMMPADYASEDEPAETPSGGTPFNEEQPRPAGDPLEPERVNAEVEKGEREGQIPRPAGHPSYVKTIVQTIGPNADTEPGAPRDRANALGAPPERETGQRPANGHALPAAATEPPAPAELPDHPLAPLDVEQLRRRVGPDQFGAWLADLRFEKLAGGTLTLSARSKFVASQIANRFERPLLECAPGGADRLDVVVGP
jgi:hypothetical protein